MRDRSAAVRFGVVVYDGVEPIDLGGTVGVVSMARRLLPNLSDAVIARAPGAVRLAGGLEVRAPYGFANAPACDVMIVCGGPGWPEASRDPAMQEFLRARPSKGLASVCTGAMILAAAGCLDGRTATTRRGRSGTETRAPLDVLGDAPGIETAAALVVDDGVVTGGGVALAIDTTLYLIGRFYGTEARDEVASVIEYDRAFRANRDALGIRLGRASGGGQSPPTP